MLCMTKPRNTFSLLQGLFLSVRRRSEVSVDAVVEKLAAEVRMRAL